MDASTFEEPAQIATWSELEDRDPIHARVGEVDLVVVRDGSDVSVLYGRCLHRGVLLADGYIEGENLICGVHGWDYRFDTGVSEYDNSEELASFSAVVDETKDGVFVDEREIRAWADENPQPYGEAEGVDSTTDPEFYGEPDYEKEPHTHYIQQLAQHGPDGIGEHGPVSAMGVPRPELPTWEDLQIQTAQLATAPLDDETPVETKLLGRTGS